MPEKINIINDTSEKKKIRTKVANTVSRYNINKKCFNCNNIGKILYDFNNPYNVVFICTDCRHNPDLLQEAEKHRINILNNIKIDLNNKVGTDNLLNKQVRWLNDETIKNIVEQFLEITDLTLGDYCKKLNISRHQFHSIVKRYKEITNIQDLDKTIKLKMNKVQKDKVIELKQKIKR